MSLLDKIKNKSAIADSDCDCDCVLILTNYGKYDYEDMIKKSKRIFDTRNAAENIRLNKERIIKL